ncbi:MAG: ABC-type transport auxiliary lipoprotein family protein [Myxococcota bacterium]
MRPLSRLFGLWLTLVAPAGCAVMNKADAIPVRYLSPAPMVDVGEESGDGVLVDATLPELRLRRVRAPRHVRRPIIVRNPDHSVAFAKSMRWTEDPRATLQSRLEQRLFHRGRLTRIVGGEAATLEVSVRRFEFVDTEPPRAIVEVAALLHDERRALFDATITRAVDVRASLSQDGGLIVLSEPFAEAMGAALDQTVRAVASRVEETLKADRSTQAEVCPPCATEEARSGSKRLDSFSIE